MQQLISHFGIYQIMLVAAALVVSLGFLCAYFLLQRPMLGTLEWIERVDERFRPLRFKQLRWTDLIAALMVAVGSVILFFSFYFFRNEWYLYSNPQEPILANSNALLNSCLGAALLSGSSFLLLYGLYGSPAAYVAAMLLPMLQEIWLRASGMLVLSLVLLMLWIQQDVNTTPLWWRGILFTAAVLAALAALDLRPAQFPLLMVFVVGFFCVLQQRRREERRKNRPGGQLSTVLLGIIALLIAVAVIWFRQANSVGIDILDYSEFLSMVQLVLSNLIWLRAPWETARFTDLFLFVGGAVSSIALLHGIVGRKKSRAVAVALVAFACVLQWLLNGSYGMTPIWMMIIGWQWSAFGKREASWLAILQVVMLAAIRFASIYLTIKFG